MQECINIARSLRLGVAVKDELLEKSPFDLGSVSVNPYLYHAFRLHYAHNSFRANLCILHGNSMEFLVYEFPAEYFWCKAEAGNSLPV